MFGAIVVGQVVTQLVHDNLASPHTPPYFCNACRTLGAVTQFFLVRAPGFAGNATRMLTAVLLLVAVVVCVRVVHTVCVGNVQPHAKL